MALDGSDEARSDEMDCFFTHVLTWPNHHRRSFLKLSWLHHERFDPRAFHFDSCHINLSHYELPVNHWKSKCYSKFYSVLLTHIDFVPDTATGRVCWNQNTNAFVPKTLVSLLTRITRAQGTQHKIKPVAESNPDRSETDPRQIRQIPYMSCSYNPLGGLRWGS